MSNEFLDFVEDILDAMDKAEILLIHGYDNVDYQIVWDVVKDDIPRIRPQLQQILLEYED